MKQKSTLITKTDHIKRKPGKPVSSLVPQNYIRNLLDHSPIQIPSQNEDIKIDFPILYAPYEELPDWPSEADLAKYDFFSLVNNPRASNKNAISLFINVNDNINQNIHLSTIPEDKAFVYQESYSQEPHFFDENNESYLPSSITTLFKSITWKRMKDYLIDNDLVKQVSNNKSHKNSHYNLDIHRYTEKIREAYYSYLASNKKKMNKEKDVINNKEGLNNSNAMNNFHSINSPNYSSNNINKNSNTINTNTDKKHFDIILEELGLNSNNNQNISINNYFDIINKEREIRITSKKDNGMSDINFPEYQQPKLISWIGSLFQYLKDNNINSNDIMNNSNEVSSLILNIYPQKDGYPVYNPIGKYWVKLFYKGKFKKVEIDDYLPFAGTEFPLFPFCDIINEFWPSLLFKSLMKLYSYKIRDSNYSEIEAGDMSYLYSLSGLVSENIPDVFEKKHDHEDNNITEKSYISDEDFKTPKNSKQKNSLKCENLNNSKIKKEFIDKIKEVLNSNNNSNECISKSYLLFYKNIDFKKYNSVKTDKFDDLITLNRNKQILGTAIDKSNNNLNSIMIEENKGNINNNNNLKLQSLHSFPADNSNLNSISKSKQNLLCLNKKNSTNNLLILNSNNYDTKSQEYCYYYNRNIENVIENNNNNNSNNDKNCCIEPFMSYYITDFFYNGIFNMNRLKLLDFSDLKKKINDNKLVYKQLSKEQKIKYITDITNLRKEYEMLKSSRIEKLVLPGDEYFFIKIMNSKLNQKNINTTNIEFTDNIEKYSIQYNEEELTTAIYCIKNKWKFPKLNYYENLFYISDKERECTLNKNKNYETTQPETEVSYNSQSKEERWNKEIYQNLLLKEPHNKEKISKEEIKINKGKWFDISIINEFTGFSLLRSYNSYKIYYNWNFEWNNYEKDYFKINREDSMIRFTPLEIIKSSRNISEKASENIKKIDKASNKNINLNETEKNNRNKNNFVNSSVIHDLGIENNNIKNNSIMIKTQESIIEKNNVSNLLNTNNTLFNALNSNKNNSNNKGSILLFFNPMRDRYSNNTNNRNNKNTSNNIDSLYIILDLFALDTKVCSIKLNTKNNSIKIPNLNMNSELYLVVNGGITPYGFNIEIFSDHFSFEKYSFQKYLTMLSFKSTVFNIPYPNLIENQYYLLSKYLISVSESTNILFEINTEDKFFSNFIQVFLVRLENRSNSNSNTAIQGNNKENINNSNNMKNKDTNINSSLISHFSSFKDSKIDLTDIKQVYPYDYITLHNIPNENEINNTHTTNNTNDNKTNYILIFSIKPPYFFNEASFQLTFNNDPNSCCIQELELTEPYEIKNTITPNKSGLLFKGFIFPSEIVLASLDFNVYSLLETNDDSSNLTKTMEKINNKLGKSNNINTSNNNLKTKTTFRSLEESVKLKCEIKSVFENEIIFKQEFFNSFCLENICLSNYYTSISNINNNTNRSIIEGTENKGILSNLSSFGNYYEISFYIDTNESKDFWNSIIQNPNFCKSKFWNIKVFPTETIAFCKNTLKEDIEKEVINTWDKTDPKRAEISKRSRLCYLLENKRNNIGEELSQEEQMILYNYYDNMKRFRNFNNDSNKSNSISNLNNSKIESKSVSSKSRVNLKNDINDAMRNNRLFTVDFSKRRLPKSENHTSLYVRNYLKYSNLKSNNCINTIKTYKSNKVNNISIIEEKKERIIEEDVKYKENLNYQDELYKDILAKDINVFSKIKNEEIIRQQEKLKVNDKIENIRKEFIRENEDKSFFENEIINMLDKKNFDFQILSKKSNLENLNNSNIGNNKGVNNNSIVGTNSNNITKNKFNNSKYSSNSKDNNNNFNNNANVSTSIKVNNAGNSNTVNTIDNTKFLPEQENVSKLFEIISKARKSNVSFDVQERLYVNFLSQMNLYLSKLLDYYNENTSNNNNMKKNNDDLINYVNSCFNSISSLKIDSNRFGFQKGKKTSNIIDEKIKKLNNLLKC